MTTTEIRSELNRALNNNDITAEEYTNANRALDKMIYRAEYNRKPEVRAKRKAYNARRHEAEKAGRMILRSL